MLSEGRPSRKLVLSLFLGAFLLAPLLYIWIIAPADPHYGGERLSTILYNAYEFNPAKMSESLKWRTIADNALKDLGPKASPLLTAWIESRPSPVRERLRELLRKKQISWPYLTADHQGIVERLFFNTPAAAVPVSDAFQWQIINGEPRDASRAASLMMWIINSVDPASRQQIARRSRAFAIALLDRFAKDNEDVYALSLVGPILEHSDEPIPNELRERVRMLAAKSRYLDSAARAVRKE